MQSLSLHLLNFNLRNSRHEIKVNGNLVGSYEETQYVGISDLSFGQINGAV